MPYWNFEYTKVIYTVVKVGGGIGQDPATEVTHLRLNQPPVFSSVKCVCVRAMQRKLFWTGTVIVMLVHVAQSYKVGGMGVCTSQENI